MKGMAIDTTLLSVYDIIKQRVIVHVLMHCTLHLFSDTPDTCSQNKQLQRAITTKLYLLYIIYNEIVH
jgi:uncharacterized membrane protein YhfC